MGSALALLQSVLTLPTAASSGAMVDVGPVMMDVPLSTTRPGEDTTDLPATVMLSPVMSQ